MSMDTAQTMTVRVVDRRHGNLPTDYVSPWIRRVTIPTCCPQCGGTRGTPQPYRFHEDGDWLECDRWSNPCGHIDTYDAVLVEARGLAENGVMARS